MSKRRKATDISQRVRKEINERDRLTCVSCGRNYNLQIAHIYLPRSRGGLGVKENLATLCIECHLKYDNGRFEDQQQIKTRVHAYMESIYGQPNLEQLKYKKEW